MRISRINPNLLTRLTEKQKKLWEDGKFVVLPVVGSVRKATEEETKDMPLIDERYKDFISIVWKEA